MHEPRNDVSFWRRCRIAIMVLAPLLASPLSAAERANVPILAPLWTIGSEDCHGVHADGDPWLECGFQAADALPDFRRILTVSARGKVQLWNGAGQQITAVDWLDEAGGASGYPSGGALISASAAVAIAHQNQLIVLDPETGAERLRKNMPFAGVELLRLAGEQLALIEFKDNEWRTHYGALNLASGEVVQEFDGISVSDTTWAVGVATRNERAILLMNDAAMTEVDLKQGCAPLNQRGLCASWNPGTSRVDVLDLAVNRWTSYRLPKRLSPNSIVAWRAIAGRLYALLCGPPPSSSNVRDCGVIDAQSRQILYRVAASWAQFVKVSGAPESESPEALLIEVRKQSESFRYETTMIRLSLDGSVREIFRTPTTFYVAAPDGGFAIMEDYKEGNPYINFDQLLLSADGAPRARLPRNYGWFQMSEDKSRVLMSAFEVRDSRDEYEFHQFENDRGLSLFGLPDFDLENRSECRRSC